MNWLNGKKTYIISILMAVVSLMHLVTGELTLIEFISGEQMMNLFEALGLTTLRVGVAKNQKDTVNEVLRNINFPFSG